MSHGRSGRQLKWFPPLLFVALAVSLFPSVGTDDSYITYWAAHTLSSGGNILNYNGVRLEQSSSMLHTVILAVLAKLIPLSLPAIGALLGLVCGALTVFLTARLAALVDERLSLLAGLLIALSTPLLYWSMGGLETSLTAAVVALLLIFIAARMTGTGATNARTDSLVVVVLVTSYLLARPEALAVIASALIGVLAVLFARRQVFGDPAGQEELAGRRAKQTLIVALVVSSGLMALRFAYFGSPVPQPVLAKTAGVSMRQGIAYLHEHALTRYDSAMWILAIAGVALVLFRTVTARSWSPAAMLMGLYVLAQSAFVLMSGGDWMPRGRFLVPMLPMVVVSGLLLVRAVRPALLVPAGAALVALQLWPVANVVRFQSPPPLWTFAGSEREYPAFSWLEHLNGEHRRDIPAILALRDTVSQLRDSRGTPVSILSGQLGMVPYHLALTHGGEIRLLDRFALSTTDFTSCPVTSGLPRDAFGLRLDYAFFMRNRAALRTACGLGDPDVIFDLTNALRRLGGDSPDRLEADGYTLVYRNAGRFIAVRTDLAQFVKTVRIND